MKPFITLAGEPAPRLVKRVYYFSVVTCVYRLWCGVFMCYKTLRGSRKINNKRQHSCVKFLSCTFTTHESCFRTTALPLRAESTKSGRTRRKPISWEFSRSECSCCYSSQKPTGFCGSGRSLRFLHRPTGVTFVSAVDFRGASKYRRVFPAQMCSPFGLSNIAAKPSRRLFFLHEVK